MSKKEVSRTMFLLGFFTYMNIMDEQLKDFQLKAKENPEKFEEALKKVKDNFI